MKFALQAFLGQEVYNLGDLRFFPPYFSLLAVPAADGVL